MVSEILFTSDKLRSYCSLFRRCVCALDRDGLELLLRITSMPCIARAALYIAELYYIRINPLQSFDNVTILFTDIVGFTTICSGLQPIAVVGLLNMMYSQFDSFTEKHGVFKVR